MLLLFVLIGAAVVAFVVWRTLGAEQAAADRVIGSSETTGEAGSRPARPAQPRVQGPDDDPDFLRSLDDKVKGRDDEPPSGAGS